MTILRLSAARRPAASLSASTACSEATTPAIEPSTPAVSQVGVSPGGGALSKMQRRQAVSPGTIVKVTPYEPTQAP
jgi:hypothetical protein